MLHIKKLVCQGCEKAWQARDLPPAVFEGQFVVFECPHCGVAHDIYRDAHTGEVIKQLHALQVEHLRALQTLLAESQSLSARMHHLEQARVAEPSDKARYHQACQTLPQLWGWYQHTEAQLASAQRALAEAQRQAGDVHASLRARQEASPGGRWVSMLGVGGVMGVLGVNMALNTTTLVGLGMILLAVGVGFGLWGVFGWRAFQRTEGELTAMLRSAHSQMAQHEQAVAAYQRELRNIEANARQARAFINWYEQRPG